MLTCCQVVGTNTSVKFKSNTLIFIQENAFENVVFKISAPALRHQCINPSPPSVAYMGQWTGSAVVQIMACRLEGCKPLFEPMLTYCQLDFNEYISMNFYLKFKYFHSRKMHLNMSSAKWWTFCPGGDELINFPAHQSILPPSSYQYNAYSMHHQ